MRNIIFIITLFCFLSCKKEEVIFNNDVDSNYELPLILNFNGKDCLYDEPTKVFKYPIDANSLTNFSPFTLFQDYSEIKLNHVNLVNHSKNTLTNLMLNTPYDLEIKTLGEVFKFKIIFTSLPLVQIISVDDIKNNAKNLAKIIVNYTNPSKASVNSYIGIEIRGKTSINLAKKSYGIKPLVGKNMQDVTALTFFDNMEKNTKWSLDGMFSDQSKQRNHASFEIWNSLGNESIKAKYVEVFVNNESLGLYRMGENYTETLLDLNSNSVLYTSVENSGITKFEYLSTQEPNKGIWEHWEQIFPDPSVEIHWNDFYLMTKLITEGSDNEFISEIKNHIEFDNLIDYYLFINLCYGYDNVGKNWYFNKQYPEDKFTILPWDLDATWGRKHDGTVLDFNIAVTNSLFERLIQLNPFDFKLKVKNRWNSLRTQQYSATSILDCFERNYLELTNYEIIGTENSIWNTDVNLNLEKNYIESWVNNRLVFLDNYFNNL